MRLPNFHYMVMEYCKQLNVTLEPFYYVSVDKAQALNNKEGFSCRFGGSDLCWRAWPMDAAAIVENAGNSGRERRLGKGCEHVQTWSGVFHNRLENASRFPRAPTGPS